MLIKIKNPPDIDSSEITPKSVYLNRRKFMQGAGLATASALMPFKDANAGTPLRNVIKSPYKIDEEPTPKEFVTAYNNYYEFGSGKEDPAVNARKFKPKPWSIAIDGEVSKPGVYNLEDIIKPHQLEERIYRLRCVEAWSMVIPWVGIPLAKVLKRFEPTSKANYVAFETLHDPKRMPGQRRRVLDWPYVEGLRIDEAMHPLALLVVGLYGEELPNQNGAPIRLITPWKYGFKSIKSIVSIRFGEHMPPTTWNKSAPREYGFFANVNPTVDHPRWSQKKERRIGDSFFTPKRKTLMFNGYEEEVASLYSGMDLKTFF